MAVAGVGSPAADVLKAADAADEADEAVLVAAWVAVANIVAAATVATVASAARLPWVVYPVRTCDSTAAAATVALALAAATVAEMVQPLKLMVEGSEFVHNVKMELSLAAIAQRSQKSIRWMAGHVQNAKLLAHAR